MSKAYNYPLEKNIEFEDEDADVDEDAVVWNCLCRKHSSDIVGGALDDGDDDALTPESFGDFGVVLPVPVSWVAEADW
jgi:hypothetical protein